MERRVDRVSPAVERGPTAQVQRKRVVVAPDDPARTSPFLLLSEDWFAAPGGFETHPHRGMQTVTLVLDGRLEHRDHTGAHGVLGPGDVQWMTAGRGALHSEMPYGGPVHTLQLWLNLPARLKMIPARYADQPLAGVPVHREAGAALRVYAGALGGIDQPHGSDWPMALCDAALEPGATVRLPVPVGYRAFVYVMAGRVALGTPAVAVAAPAVAWVDPAAGAGALAAAADGPARLLLAAGPPIDEPVAFGGPFVMNSEAEVRQAFLDYHAGRLI